MKINKKIVSIFISGAIVFGFACSSHAEKYSRQNYRRIHGKDRFETSIELSKDVYSSSKKVILTDPSNLEETVDALNASAKYKAPLLFYSSESEPALINELSRLKTSEIYSNSKLNLYNCEVKNLPKYYDYKNDSAVLVSNITDGIIAASYARNNNSTLVYINDNNRSDIIENLKNTGVKKLTIIGGKNSVSEIVDPYFEITRISGNDRYETSKLLVEKSGSNNVILTSGENVIDSLASTSLSEKKNATILLCNNDASNVDLKKYKVDAIVGGLVKVRMNVFYLIPHQDDEVLQVGIDIYRDVMNGDNVRVILFTDGSRTSSIKDINRRLKSEGKPLISSEKIATARNKEFELALSTLGVNKENITYLGYINKGLLKTDVMKHLDSIIKSNNNVVLKTLSRELVNHKDGSLDHLAITWATEDCEKNYNIPASYYVRSERDSILTDRKYKTISLTDDEKEIMRKALSAYTIWDPSNGFYSVGGFSVGGSFANKKNNPIYYIEYWYIELNTKSSQIEIHKYVDINFASFLS